MRPDDLAAFDAIVSQIEGALDAQLYTAAIVVTLALPDICASLSSADGRSDGNRYAAWFDENMAEYAEGLPGAQAYMMRCGMLHQAKPTRPDMRWQTVGFTFGGGDQYLSSGNSVDGVILPDTFFVDAVKFCTDLATAAREWMRRSEDNANVKRNISNLLRRGTRNDPLVGNLDVLA